mmetsp:Transcript_20367/g.63861  ORF Transcript_20367/g.63861 Transcript_20367/m.63861 type:complete len:223 (+) Transcript_20367:1979-2647(+)
MRRGWRPQRQQVRPVLVRGSAAAANRRAAALERHGRRLQVQAVPPAPVRERTARPGDDAPGWPRGAAGAPPRRRNQAHPGQHRGPRHSAQHVDRSRQEGDGGSAPGAPGVGDGGTPGRAAGAGDEDAEARGPGHIVLRLAGRLLLQRTSHLRQPRVGRNRAQAHAPGGPEPQAGWFPSPQVGRPSSPLAADSRHAVSGEQADKGARGLRPGGSQERTHPLRG